MISGMAIEIIADAGDQWQAFNITSQQTVYFKKLFLQKAIKLGKAEQLSQADLDIK
ncbi:MAG: hypothetical protein OEY36_10765 [Gammaproteobacteria bacterium]|nr:hypothetical protein [Gammaproteobacteria bacterium]